MKKIQHNGNSPLTEEEKLARIAAASTHYGNFLTALGFDWKDDDHMKETPKRVAKAWMNDLAVGCFSNQPNISVFPNETGYSGLICQSSINVTSMCAHHGLPFTGIAHVGYIPGQDTETHMIIGLSKLNRIVDWYSRRPNVQESLTMQIHTFLNKLLYGNRGVAVVIKAKHQCVGCRGVRQDSLMSTSQLSGYFHTDEVGTRTEFFSLISQAENAR